MLEIENKLFDKYKIVDSICRDIFQSQSGVTQYITEMEQNFSRGSSVVSSWNDDYYKLKHIRWLRNQIAHESSVTDCNGEDVAWLEEFHRRLLAQQDPLALLRTANRKRTNFPQQRKITSNIGFEKRIDKNVHLQKRKKSFMQNIASAIVVFIEIIIILAAVAVLLMYINS